MASIMPITNAPVSPIKTSEGSQLKIKKAKIAPTIENDRMEKIKSSIKKNQTPKAISESVAIVPANPSSPSIRLNEFVITIIVKYVSR